MWTSTFAFGAFLGPSISGILYDNFGFRDSTYFVIVLEVLVAVMFVTFTLFYKENQRISNSEMDMDNLTSLDETSLLIPKTNRYETHER
jgi:hypothetical protein